MATAKKKTGRRTRLIRSAAAALGGKMSTAAPIRLAITNVLGGGDFTGTIYAGSQQRPVNVILDTGSSTLAIDAKVYDATKDTKAKITDIAQEVGYDDGSSWVGALVLTDIRVGSVDLPRVNAAVAYHATATMFGKSSGILGLAYTKLNDAYKMPGPTIPPKYTYNQIQEGKKTYVEPYFTQLESAGLVANKFAFYIHRSTVNLATTNPATDPLNRGYLILGGGEEMDDLYTGSFQVARVVNDTYYNTNLKAIAVGNSTPIPVEPPTKVSGDPSNSIVDSGTNGIYLHQTIFDQMLRQLSISNADALRAGYVPMSKLDLSTWPTIIFVLEGALGTDVRLEVTPDAYWQTNSQKAGHAEAVIYGTRDKGQAILGLPVMNKYFTVFDRSVDKGLGVVSFAKMNPNAR